MSTTTFESFDLSPAVKKGLARLGFTSPTPVQVHAIPLALAGKDAIVLAKTGSGKTLAFGLPLLTMLKPQPKPQCLVVAPTRELAIQICEAIKGAGAESPLRLLPIYGGVGLGPQETALRKGVDMVVGTPGRLKDLIGRGSLDLSGITVLVLDEADEMLDMGFRRDIEFLLDRMPGRKQTLIFSATMPDAIEVIAHKHMKKPEVVRLTTGHEESPSDISHHFLRVREDERFGALVAMIKAEQPTRGLVFTRMKHETKKLATRLETQAGINAGYLNGNMSQNARNTMMARFRAGEIDVLVATDVAARGLDVEGLSHVFHYAVPTVVETYVHRSGRTGRAGNEGKTIILVTPDADGDFRAIQKKVKLVPYPLDLASLPAMPAAPPEGPRPQGRGRGNQPPRDRAVAPRDRVPAPRPRDEAPKPSPRPVEGGWKTIKLNLGAGHRKTAEDLHAWLSQQTRVSKSSLRSIRVHADHATVEVASEAADRFLQRLRTPGR